MKNKAFIPVAAIIAVLVTIYNNQYNKHADSSRKHSFVEGEEFPDPNDGRP